MIKSLEREMTSVWGEARDFPDFPVGKRYFHRVFTRKKVKFTRILPEINGKFTKMQGGVGICLYTTIANQGNPREKSQIAA